LVNSGSADLLKSVSTAFFGNFYLIVFFLQQAAEHFHSRVFSMNKENFLQDRRILLFHKVYKILLIAMPTEKVGLPDVGINGKLPVPDLNDRIATKKAMPQGTLSAVTYKKQGTVIIGN